MSSCNQQQIPFSSTSSTSPLVWFQLFDSATGEPYKDTSVSSITRSSLFLPVVDNKGTSGDGASLPSDSVIAQFRDAVHLKNSSILTGITSSQILVYKNKADFDKRNAAFDDEKKEPVDPTDSLDFLGSKEDMLVVVVPSSRNSSLCISESSLMRREPHPKRKQRWIELNKIFEENAKKFKANDSTSFSDNHEEDYD